MIKSKKELAPNSVHYLDFAGAALPSRQFLQRITANLLSDSRECLLANPHSGHMMGRRTRDRMQLVRTKILAHFGVNDATAFSVIFTANATNALKLLAEHFGIETKRTWENCAVNKQFSTDVKCLLDGSSASTLLMLRDSHTSVVGMRNVTNFDRVVVVNYEELCQFLAELDPKDQFKKGTAETKTIGGGKKHLFVMTAMSNFCGRVYDMALGQQLKRVLGAHWFVCIDSAALAPYSADIGLSFCDFAVISFYKMFGYPTGIGALIVRRSSAHCLQKNGGYFGGGTVKFSLPTSAQFEFRDSIEERFEDGTCNFYAISALSIAFEEMQPNVLAQSMQFAERAFAALNQMKHANGAPIAIVYGIGWKERNQKINAFNNCEQKLVQGPIVNFNLLREDGSFVGFAEVDKMADLFGIQLRTGCHCNLGACSMHLGITDAMMAQRYQQNGKQCGDDMDLYAGKPLGSVRISFGRTSTQRDCEAFLRMLAYCFCGPTFASAGPFAGPTEKDDVRRVSEPNQSQYPTGLGTLTHLFVYPVKSCAAMARKSWPLCPYSGSLLFDRHWMIVSCAGEWMTQKRCSALCSILPEIDYNGNEMMLKERHNIMPLIRIATKKQDKPSYAKNVHSNGGECLERRKHKELVDYGGQSLSFWLSELDPVLEGSKLVCCSMDGVASSNFSNKANFLLITRSSTLFIASRLSLPYERIVERFRPNFVVDFGPNSKPFEEEKIDELAIGSVEFLAVGSCQRCQMICIDQQSGQKDPNVLVTLRDLRRSSNLSFGIYLERKQRRGETDADSGHDQQQTNLALAMSREIHVGCAVCVTKYK